MFYTIYKTTNLVNGKYYIGKHQTKNLRDGYIGSGKYLKRAIEKYGKDSFVTDILYVFDEEWKMNLAEKILVTIDQETCYNLCSGGKGGFGYINDNSMNNKNHDIDDVRNKKSKSLKNIWTKIEYIDTMKNIQKNNHALGLMQKGYFGNRGDVDKEITEKASSPESKAKRRETYERLGIQKGSNNSQYGKPRSEETKNKIRESLKKTRELKKV
jgi:hypothetical protein